MTDLSERFSRHTMLKEFGVDGQKKLNNASVLIVGAGGLGSAVINYLAAAGVGTLGIIDPDIVSLSNLQRQTLYSESQVNVPKPIAAAERIRSMNSETRVATFPFGLTKLNAARIVSQFDLIIDCCDNFPTRYLLDDVCAELGKPWVHGSLGEFCGQLTVFNHKLGKRYVDVYPDRDYLCSLSSDIKGVVGVIPGIIGCLQASEALKIIVGYGKIMEGEIFYIDCKEMTTEYLKY